MYILESSDKQSIPGELVISPDSEDSRGILHGEAQVCFEYV